MGDWCKCGEAATIEVSAQGQRLSLCRTCAGRLVYGPRDQIGVRVEAPRPVRKIDAKVTRVK